jgi:predicted permease
MMWPFHRRDRGQELDDEIRAQLEMAASDAVERGASDVEARARVRRDFGNIPHVKEATRAVTGWPSLEQAAHDFARAAKRIARSPGFSAAAIAMLAVAIGLTTAMFSLLDALVLRPVPFPDADRLTTIMMFHGTNGHGTGRLSVPPAVFRAWRDVGIFDAVEGYLSAASVLGDEEPVMGDVAYVSPSLVATLGGRPVLGRGLTQDDARDGVTPGALVARAFWRDRLAGEQGAIGSRLVVDGRAVTIVGVLPETFRFPSRETAVWIAADFSSDRPPVREPDVVVRLARGVSRADAMRVATDRAHAADPSMTGWDAQPQPVAGGDVPEFQRRSAALLAGGAGLVFIVLAANLASLLLVRFGGRRRELSVSSALGASRSRLLRQVLAETCVLGALGGAAGGVFAVELLAAARALLPPPFFAGSLNPLTLDSHALVIAGAASVLATILAGLVPAIVATRPSPAWSLDAVERAGTESRRARLLMRALIIGEVAFACTLLVGAASLVRSFSNLAAADRGFDPRGLVTVWLGPDNLTGSNPARRRAARTSAEAAVRTLAGVEQVAWSNGSPGASAEHDFYQWRTDTSQSAPVFLQLQQYRISREFFAIYGIRLLRGRPFRPDEDRSHVVIGDRLAAALWPDANPVGHSFSAVPESGHDALLHFTVIGVAKDIRRPSLDGAGDAIGLYTPFNPDATYSTLTIKCGDACPSEAVVRTTIAAASPSLRVFRVTRLEDAYAQDLDQPRVTAVASSAFSVIALVAAAAGLFSVLSYAVSRRRREFGIRVALGCSPAAVRRLVVREGLTIALAGGALGSGLAWFVVRLLASLEYGVSARDPLNWAVVLAVVTPAALAASWRPAAQAMRVDPALLLRQE